MATEVRVPDIGDFSDVDVIDGLVKAGDTVTEENALITLESDKASMDIPSPQAGKIVEMKIAVGDSASEGTVVWAAPRPRGSTSPRHQSQGGISEIRTQSGCILFRPTHTTPLDERECPLS